MSLPSDNGAAITNIHSGCTLMQPLQGMTEQPGEQLDVFEGKQVGVAKACHVLGYFFFTITPEHEVIERKTSEKCKAHAVVRKHLAPDT